MPTEPLVLLANADQWLTESLETVLTQGGYRVLATAKRQQVLELARRYLPDGILLDMGLDQRANDNLALCRALRAASPAPREFPRACGVFHPADGVLTSVAADRLALAFQRAGRISDAVCRTGAAEFAVFAPATDETGAEGLVQRITDTVSRIAAVKLRAGISTAPAVPKRPSVGGRTSTDLHQPPPPSTTDLIDRARNALH